MSEQDRKVFYVDVGDKSPEELKQILKEIKEDDWDCGCPRGAEDECVSIICPRK